MTGFFARAAASVAVAAAVSLTLAGTASAAEPGGPPGASPQQATPTEKAAAEVRPAIVYLTETFTAYVGDSTGYFNYGNAYTLNATCTGFGVNPQGYIATAGHCVDTTSADGIRADFVEQAARDFVAANPRYNLQDVYTYGLANWTVEGTAKGSPIESQFSAVIGSGTGGKTKGQALPARLVDFRPIGQGDVALLKVESSDLPTAHLGSDADAAIGTPVLSIGYPASADSVTDTTLEPSNKDGQISTKRTMGSVPFYETSASLSPGMSGGPTVDLKGDVVGINSSHLRTEQAFNFIAPSNGLTELLARNGVKNEQGPNDKLYQDALASYYGGHYSEAIAGFDRLLLVDPDHGQAQQYKTLAAKAKERFGDTAPAAPPAAAPASDEGPFGLAPWLFWTIVGGGSALVVGGVVLTIALLRRRGGVAPAPVPAPQGYSNWTPGGQGYPQVPAARQELPWGSAPAPVAAPAPAPVAPSAPSAQAAPSAPFAPSAPVNGSGSDGPTTIVTPAEILASQRPAPQVPSRFPAPSTPAAPVAPVNGAASESDVAAGATAVVSLPKGGNSRSCGTCGSTVTPGAVFCATCGTKQ
ncbi:hypothetical protein GCM10009836_27720 [Pseudonocardia ailaonensis]|uniref:Uncharacterized protein n=1 Tax=Pseudonocardia ailaonensis TaxID=367279 RepID=A0ABN2N1H5_9PSEU